MATPDITRKFAVKAMEIERLLAKAGITGEAGRVVLMLTMADKNWGVPQAEVIQVLALPKDVVSKLARSLVRARVLRQEREGRTKQLYITSSGRRLLSRVKLALSPPRSTKAKPASIYRSSLLDGLK
jgi:predicted transcriptional regulator